MNYLLLISKRLVLPFFCTIFASQTTLATEEDIFSFGDIKSIKVVKYGKNLKIRGFKLNKNIYMGQAKVAGKYGLGLVVEQKKFTLGINNRGISFFKQF